jgi:hypothetical protein
VADKAGFVSEQRKRLRFPLKIGFGKKVVGMPRK